MTLVELQARRDEIVKAIGITRETFGARSVEYADAAKALEVLDAEIRTATAAAASPGTANTWRGTYATFAK